MTEAGHLLLRHADSIVARLQAAQADLQALRAGEVGTLRVGTFQSVGARVLPEIMRRFSESWPAIEVVLVEMDDFEIELALERGELDVGFVLLPVLDAPLETIELLSDPYVLVTPVGSPLALAARPTLAQIGADPLVGFRSDRSIEPVEAALHGAGVEPRFAFRSNDNPTVQGLVAAGIGNAVMPRLTVDDADTRVVVRELDLVPSRVIAIAQHRDRYHSPAARAFVETALGSVQ
jgi:DNA-binding transcriptional LysR family regulator